MIYFRGEPLARQTIDMVVDQRVVVEAKSTERLPPDAHRQLFGYLCASTLEVGLLLHFGKEAKFNCCDGGLDEVMCPQSGATVRLAESSP